RGMRPHLLVACLIAALAALAACGGASEDDAATADRVDAPVALADCGVEGAPRLTGDGIGALRIGETVKQVTLACHVLRDTIGPGPEGSQERSLLVRIGPRPDTVRAVVVSDSIWRLHVTS